MNTNPYNNKNINNMDDPQLPIGSSLRYEKTMAAQKLRDTRKNVNEVVDIMHANVQTAMERQGKLSDMDERSRNLEHACAQFKTNSVKLRKKMWYQNMRMKFIIGLIVTTVLLLLIWAIMANRKN